ncbi:MAG TPA: ATP-binding protein [Nitrososphaeraceae archaeon]|nr:ATP-binding protein [Nitrososphaeraceae archaeon]
MAKRTSLDVKNDLSFVTKSVQGTGLGLSIAKKIIDAHGGQIWAQNHKDEKGATVSFSLPLYK